MKTYIFLTSLLLLFSCNKKAVKMGPDYLNVAKKHLNDYVINHDKSDLKLSYAALQKDKQFHEKGLNDENRHTVVSIYMYSGKYKELKKLLIDDITVDKFKKEITTNLLEALTENNREQSKLYLKKNISLINEKLIQNPQDSLLYIDYFTMKLYLEGRSEVLKEIDSMKHLNKRFSPDYYDLILSDMIKDYPDEFLSAHKL